MNRKAQASQELKRATLTVGVAALCCLPYDERAVRITAGLCSDGWTADEIVAAVNAMRERNAAAAEAREFTVTVNAMRRPSRRFGLARLLRFGPL